MIAVRAGALDQRRSYARPDQEWGSRKQRELTTKPDSDNRPECATQARHDQYQLRRVATACQTTVRD